MKKIFDSLLDVLVKFSTTKAMTALKDGFVITMPITLLGSVFMLLANIPVNGYAEFMTGIFGAGWDVGLNQVSGATFDILAILSVIGIGFSYSRNEGFDGMSSGVLALVAFLILTPSNLTQEGMSVSGIIPKAWTGGQGVIAAILIGLSVGYIYTLFLRKNITIKLPSSVPTGVTNAFTSLIPGLVIMAISMIIFQVFNSMDTSMVEWIFTTMQIPMQNLSGSFVGGLTIVILISLLFWAGLHGPNIVMGVMAPILTANSLINSDLASQGLNTVANGAKIVTPQVIDNFVKLGGAGVTIGLLIAVLLNAKSEQLRSISKLSFVPGLFNINEPVIYGLPIVFNPILIAPFILVPVMAYVLTYFATVTGFIVPFIGVQVPWTMPPILSGFILSGLNGALLQLVIIVLSVAIYFPFMKYQDSLSVAEEAKNEAA